MVRPWAAARPRAVRAASCCLLPRQISGRRAACPPARRPRRELRSARRLEARPGPAHGRRSQPLCFKACPGPAARLIDFARNSPATCSGVEFASLELQRFWGVSKNDRDKLRAKFGWRWSRCRPLRPSAPRASIGALARCPAPPPTGPAARPSGLSGTLHADGGGGFAALEAGCWRVGGVSDL